MRIIGQSQLAAMFGVTEKTIVEWQDEGMPVELRGQAPRPNEYLAADCIRWYVDREVRKVRAESPRDRVFRLQAEDLELKLAEKRGQLVPTAMIEPKLRAAIVAAREHLMGERRRIAALAVGKSEQEVLALLEKAFSDTLRRLAEWRQEPVEADE